MTTILTTADLDDPELTERQKRLIVELAIAADAVLAREGWELESRGIELLWESVILRHTETGERTWLSMKADPAPVVEPEPRPEPAREPRIVFGDGADRVTFMKLVEQIGEGWVIGITDSAGKVVDVELSHTTAEAVVGWRFDAEAGESTTEQVRVPVEQVVEVKVW